MRLVLHRASKETIDALAALLAEARAGEVVGLAYVAMHNGATYSADVTGTAKAARAYTIGTLRHLEKRLLED